MGRVPRNYGANITLIASLSLQGMGEALILEGAADASAFELYVEQILTPSLHSGQTVVMDNLSIHQGVRVRKAIEAKGCHLLYTHCGYLAEEPSCSDSEATMAQSL